MRAVALQRALHPINLCGVDSVAAMHVKLGPLAANRRSLIGLANNQSGGLFSPRGKHFVAAEIIRALWPYVVLKVRHGDPFGCFERVPNGPLHSESVMV